MGFLFKVNFIITIKITLNCPLVNSGKVWYNYFMTGVDLHKQQADYRKKLLTLKNSGLSYQAIANMENKEYPNVVKLIRRARKDRNERETQNTE
jgi:hypothetical protein